jgi:hypothetical protein
MISRSTRADVEAAIGSHAQIAAKYNKRWEKTVGLAAGGGEGENGSRGRVRKETGGRAKRDAGVRRRE